MEQSQIKIPSLYFTSQEIKKLLSYLIITSNWLCLNNCNNNYEKKGKYSAIQLGNMSKILTNNSDKETIKYIPKRELWINRFYFEIAKKIILV